MRNTYPPSIIDVEASGFGAKSYPIEIGVVRHDGAKWCKLIRPFDHWVHWDDEAEALQDLLDDEEDFAASCFTQQQQDERINALHRQLDEELDDVKHMNQMVLYSKVVTIRDKQLNENKRLE